MAELMFLAGYLVSNIINKPTATPVINQYKKIDRPLEKYSIENLSNTEIKSGKMNIDSVVSDTESYTSYMFYYTFHPEITGNLTKTTTGIINIPKNTDIKGIILTIRGYVDQNIFTSGMGTKNVAQYFAENGFVTIAPDFLGYGGSDKEASNIFESRFQTYVTILTLLKTLDEIENTSLFSANDTVTDKQLSTKLLNISNIYIWSHSNGGQIALTILEITKRSYPTVLWAPVSKPFPYSILYYTDDSDDKGKFIRSELAKFENLYDVEKYSLTNYLDRIEAGIQIHQGTSDEAVPFSWSDKLVKTLRSLNKNVEYIIHQGADHNLRPEWDEAVKLSLQFYIENVK